MPAAPRSPLPKSFFLFLGIVLLFTLGNSSDAFLILRAQSLGMTLLEIPLVIALFNFVYAMFAVPFGSLSDRIGRIPTIIIGWSAYALVYLGFALAGHAYPHLVPLRFLWNLLRDESGRDQGISRRHGWIRSSGAGFGIYGTSVGLMTLLASFFAGFLWDHFGPQAPFYFGAAMAMAAAIALVLCSKRLRTA